MARRLVDRDRHPCVLAARVAGTRAASLALDTDPAVQVRAEHRVDTIAFANPQRQLFARIRIGTARPARAAQEHDAERAYVGRQPIRRGVDAIAVRTDFRGGIFLDDRARGRDDLAALDERDDLQLVVAARVLALRQRIERDGCDRCLWRVWHRLARRCDDEPVRVARGDACTRDAGPAGDGRDGCIVAGLVIGCVSGGSEDECQQRDEVGASHGDNGKGTSHLSIRDLRALHRFPAHSAAD